MKLVTNLNLGLKKIVLAHGLVGMRGCPISLERRDRWDQMPQS